MQYAIPVVVIAVLISINGLFVAAEFAIAGSSRPRFAYLAEQGSTAAQQLLDIKSSPQRMGEYLSTAQVGITIASLGLGMYGEPTFAQWILPILENLGIHSEVAAHTIATILTVGFLTYLHVVLGEMVPKSIALLGPVKAAIRLYPFMAFSQKFFNPLTLVLNWIGNWLLVLLRMPPSDAETRLITPDDLSYIVEESREGGVLQPSEQVFLENVIDFHERSVGQVMTPRTRIVALPADADIRSIMSVVCNQRYSRFPIFSGNKDHIIGILHLKDLARRYLTEGQGVSVREVMRPAVFVPESLALDEMLAQFRSRRNQIAIVVDEYGGTAGLVTMEDLAEEIIGEIQDEYDEEIAPFLEISQGRIRVRGDLLLDELDQHFDINLDVGDAQTVGGFIMSKLGRVPVAGDSILYADIKIEVESVEGLAVRTAIIEMPHPPRSDE